MSNEDHLLIRLDSLTKEDLDYIGTRADLKGKSHGNRQMTDKTADWLNFFCTMINPEGQFEHTNLANLLILIYELGLMDGMMKKGEPEDHIKLDVAAEQSHVF